MRPSLLLTALLCTASLLAVRAADKPAEKPAKETASKTPADKKDDKSKDDKDSGRKPRSRINKDGKEIRVCNLRLCWWAQPENPPELALQFEKSRQPFSPDTLGFSNPLEYEGEPAVVILRRHANGGVDSKGKPIDTWEPYATFTLRPTDDDLGVVLFENPAKNGAQVRLFDFSAEAFPYGSMRVVNFTRTKVLSSLGGAAFAVEPGATARCPKTFTQRTRAHLAFAVQEADNSQHVLESSVVIFYPSIRAMAFVIEKPGTEANERFHVQTITDSAPVQIAKTAAVVATGLREAPAPELEAEKKAAAQKSGAGTSPPTAKKTP